MTCSGHSEIALSYYKRAMRIHEHRFGKNHPNVSSVCTNLAVLCVLFSPLATAFMSISRAMTGAETRREGRTG